MTLSRLRLVGAAVLAVATFSCSQEKSPPSPSAEQPQVIEPGVSVGPIKAGMIIDQVTALLGEPQRRTANALEYTRLGFAVVLPGADQVVQFVMCGDVTGLSGPLVKAFSARTKEGIGMTSTRDEVVGAYGQPTSSQAFLGGRESLRYEGLGITFSLEGGKVHHMIIRLGAAEASTPASSIEVTK